MNSALFWQTLTFMKPPDYRELFRYLGLMINGLIQKLATFFESQSPAQRGLIYTEGKSL